MVWLQAAFLATVFSAGGETVLLDFYADWCGPCRAMSPTIDALVAEGFPVRKINIDREGQLAVQYGVPPVPCYVMLVDGREVDRVVGGTTYSRLKRMCMEGLARQPREQPPPMSADDTAAGARTPIAVPAIQSTPPLMTAAGQLGQTPAGPAPSGRQPPTPGWTPQPGAAAALDSALIAASVRLRVEDDDGYSCGSGTIIDARGGEALILTCGHIFRDSQGRGRIEVDLFGPKGVQRVEGQLRSYDLDRDLGLLSIRTPGPVATARMAPPGYQIAAGDSVVTVGCNNGDRPTARHSQVTSLDKFLPPPNLQVAGLPVEGRSGGGLFSQDGLVIGVCFAADPECNEGLYAALDSIHTELDRARLAFVYRTDGPDPASQPASAPPNALAAAGTPPLPARIPLPSGGAPVNGHPMQPTAPTAGDAVALSVEERAALHEIGRRLQEGAEVVCVVSPREPGARSEVIILDRVSPALLGQLAAMARSQDPPRATSLEVPRERQPGGNPLGNVGGWRLSGLEPAAKR